MKVVLKTALVALPLLLSACASHPQAKAKPIPWNQYVTRQAVDVMNPDFSNFRIVGTDQVVLWDSPREAYLVTTAGGCFFDNSNPVLGFTNRDQMFNPLTDTIIYDHQRCPVVKIDQLNTERLKADGVFK
ncbi:DUF6491 family protein [Gallaecimonas pentaromativorans]|uniref:DUF6491 family protein n=1 Tax=Gallaecimonas pentaromativorans TaxID=584787 RepID=UPI003A8F605F